MKRVLLILFVFSVLSCQRKDQQISMDEKVNNSLIEYVNPMVGTSKMGHVFPGATAPFGMVQLSPQTNWQVMYDSAGNYNKSTYEYCAGYQYRDTTILGFAHTNFSGTGHSDLGDLLVMPMTGELNLAPFKTDNGEKGYYSRFSHDKEEASPGYYKVALQDYGITAELTSSERVGVHRYTFSENSEAHILFDLVYNVYHHDNKNVWTFVRVENDSTITGYRQTKGWARTKKVFFKASFSKPFKSFGHKKYGDETYVGFYRRFDQETNFPEMSAKQLKAYFSFDMEKGEELIVKMALSNVSMAGAEKNMVYEVPHWDFDQVRQETEKKWQDELRKIEVEMMNEADMTTFYTAMYHACLTPILYEDVNGSYRGLDQNIHQSDSFTNYSIFSLWDTYRALHPLLNLFQPERNNDMIKSMLVHQEQSVHGMLPIWSHYANENWCMIGYHAVSVIADAVTKGIGDFDIKRALDACIETSNVPYFDGLGEYIQYGYVPDDLSHSAVSKTLEYAYDDWCISKIAYTLGLDSLGAVYAQRATSFERVYDPEIGHMRPKLSSGEFREQYDPMDTHGQGFIEGNAWNYGLYVPQDIDRMIQMMGGNEAFINRLDSLFTMEIEDKYIEKHEDITRDGIIGNYVHGNEPGHHIPYLYNWAGAPEKTQERVRMIMRTMYGPNVNGLCGNDDAGQMSAWYIFSALGFYPVTPGSPYYAIGSPLVKKAKVDLGNGNILNISTINQSETNTKVRTIKFNDRLIEGFILNHLELAKGGELVFEMSN